MFLKPQHLHFTGIGGIGMSAIAEVLLSLGFPISGSDLKLSPITDRLAALGAKILEGHAAENIEGARAVVISSAVKDDNPEVEEARRRQIPVIPRGEMLAELMRQKYGIAVAGSHGKTTTTSMLATMLSHAGKDPTVMVGGRLRPFGGSNARIGASELLVVESDESDGSFLKLSPIIGIVTNIDREHLDHYRDIGEIRGAFIDFINKVPFYGAAVLCLDDENVQKILPSVTRRTVTYGTDAQAHLHVAHMSCSHFSCEFQVAHRGADLGCFRLQVPGAHNVLNAAAAIAVGLELGVPVELMREALAEFGGVDRRFQVRGVERGITVVDDYGHHPTEIRSTLAAARQCRYGRVLVIFQPHRYSRTVHLMDDFGRSFYQADSVHVLDIYAASERPIEGVSGQAIVDRLRAYGHRSAAYAGTMDRAVEAVLAEAREGDLVITLGAGNVWQAGDRVLERLRET